MADRAPPKIRRVEDLGADLAGRYFGDMKACKTTDPALLKQAEADIEGLRQQGYVVLRDIIDADTVRKLREAVEPLLTSTGRNNFEGLKTQRVYNLLAKTRAFDNLAAHPRVTALLDALFMPNYLISQAQVINILPGEAPQLLHHDDGFYPVPRPRPPFGAATIWAVDDFTEENGATRVIPGSHLWGDEHTPEEGDSVPVTMTSGSAVFFVGTLWHGGGANRSDAARLAMTAQYCEPWLRQQESFLLELEPATVKQMPVALQEMVGYSIHPPFMGAVDGRHPKRLLEPTTHHPDKE